MSTELKPCPFCGAGKTDIHPNGRIWSGMKFSEPTSVSIRHWCEDVPGQPHRMIERVGRDEASAVEAWNRRALSAQPPTMTAATWTPAPASTEWGADMLAADVALSADETLTMYATQAGVALIAQPPADPTALCLRLQTEADMWRANGDENLCVLLEEAIAAISQPPAPSVPGWQWVPVEPTRDMCATANANMQYGSCTAHQVWAAMLSAAPPPVPSVHVGDSAFESWYSTYWPQDGSNKQRMRDAYAAGMLDRAPPPVRERLTLDAVIAMAVGAGLGHALSPIGLDTGKVFRTDAAYRTSELEEFARAIGRALIGGEG